MCQACADPCPPGGSCPRSGSWVLLLVLGSAPRSWISSLQHTGAGSSSSLELSFAQQGWRWRRSPKGPCPQTTVSPPGEPRPHLPPQHPQLLWHKVGGFGALRLSPASCKELKHQGLGLLPSTSQLLGSQSWSCRATACPQGVLPVPPFPCPTLGWGPGTIPRSTCHSPCRCCFAPSCRHHAPPRVPFSLCGEQGRGPPSPNPPCCSSCKQEGAQHSTDTPLPGLVPRKPIALRLPPALGARPHLPPGQLCPGTCARRGTALAPSPAPAPSPLPSAQVTSSRCLFLLGAVLQRPALVKASFIFLFFSLLGCAAQPCGLGLSEDKACVYILYLDVFL